MESLVKRFFKLNLIIMRLAGFYPPQKFKKLYNLYAFAVYVCFTIPVPTLAAVHLIVGEDIDLTQVADSSFMTCQVGCFIIKLIPFIFNYAEIRESIYMLEWPIFNSYILEQGAIIDKGIKICKRNTCLFLGFCVATLILWCTAPFFDNRHDFPIDIWLPFDPTANKTIYVFVFIFISLGVINGGVSNGVIDPLVSGLACFAVGQLQLLKNNLEHLSTYAENELANNTHEDTKTFHEKIFLKNNIIYLRIKQCINHQNAILKFIEFYENVFSLVAFTQFTTAVVVICVTCLRLIMVKPFTYTFFLMVTFLLTMVLEIFLYSYFGSRLIEESSSLTTAIYMGKWYEYDLKCRHALILLMERSKKPIIVTAGKILELSLVTFATVIRRAYSLLAVLKNY